MAAMRQRSAGLALRWHVAATRFGLVSRFSCRALSRRRLDFCLTGGRGRKWNERNENAAGGAEGVLWKRARVVFERLEETTPCDAL